MSSNIFEGATVQRNGGENVNLVNNYQQKCNVYQPFFSSLF
jgi:hypothetical protein